MGQTLSILLATFVVCLASPAARAPEPPPTELVATADPEAVYVAFEGQPVSTADLEARLSKAGSATSITWTVELKRAARFWKDRHVARAHVYVYARRIGSTETFSLTRRVNGEVADGGVQNLQAAIRWLTSFPRVSVFERQRLIAAPPYAVEISAAVEGGDEPHVVTAVIARTLAP